MEESFVILSSQKEILKKKIPGICKIFDVKVVIHSDPNQAENDRNHWVIITGKDGDERKLAKAHIIAICNPEVTEKVSFPGFPTCIFVAFEERCKHSVERSCEIVLTVFDDNSMNLQGTNIGVTMATSKIHHMNKLLKDKDFTKNEIEAKNFNLRLRELGETKYDFLALSNSLKKELLEMIGMPQNPISDAKRELEVPNATTSAMSCHNSPTSPTSDLKGVQVADATASGTSYETMKTAVTTPTADVETTMNNSIIEIKDEDSIIVISSNSEESDQENESDDEEDGTDPKNLAADGPQAMFDIKYLLPPQFAIVEWFKIHYEGTNNPTDYIAKRDMLEHFRGHFDIPEHPELANLFFDKLAITIFKLDQNYRSVKTKKSKSKHSRRRLTCLRRKTISESEKEEKAVAIKSSLMTDWNANRTEQSKQRIAQALPGTCNTPPKDLYPIAAKRSSRLDIPVKSVPTIPPVRITQPPRTIPTSFPQPIQQHVPARISPPTQIMPAGFAPPLQHVSPAPPLQPYYPPRPYVNPPQPNQYQSIAARVSRMTVDELLSPRRPQFNPHLRPIIIDGSNVAMHHGNHKNFSCRGIAISARIFIERGHRDVTCFVPNYRKGGGGNPPSNDSHILMKLENLGVLKCTPSRRVRGQNIVCYDDRFIVELAEANNGVILSNDQYRDLMFQNPRWRPIIEERLLQFTIVNDLLMLPEDPHGRNGPTLEDFLILRDANRPLVQTHRQLVRSPPPTQLRAPFPIPFGRYQGPIPHRRGSPNKGTAYPALSHEEESVIIEELLKVFPNRDEDVRKLIRNHPFERNVSKLCNYMLISDTGQ